MSREVCLHGELTSNFCTQCAEEYLKGMDNFEDNLYPHSDEAGRVPGAMHVDRAQDGADTTALVVLDRIVADSRKVERNRLVWEAYMQSKSTEEAHVFHDSMHLDKAIRAVDEYLQWRDKQ